MMKGDAMVGGSVTGLRDAIADIPEYRFYPETLEFAPVGLEAHFDAPAALPSGVPSDEVVFDDDMTAGLPGLGIQPLGVVGQDGSAQ